MAEEPDQGYVGREGVNVFEKLHKKLCESTFQAPGLNADGSLGLRLRESGLNNVKRLKC